MGLNIETNQNVRINYEICSVGDRMLAFLIDTVVIIGIILVFRVIFGSAMEYNKNLAYYAIVFNIPIFFYHFICELTMNGQSIGKRNRNIRVIKADGRPGTFTSYFIRFLLRPIDSIYAMGLAFIFFTKKGQRIGDLAAGTVVVAVNKNVSLQDIHQPAGKDRSEIEYPEVGQLTDDDVALIKKILNQRKLQPGHENVHLLADKIKSLLNVTSGQTDYRFLKKIIADYHAYFDR